MEKLTKAGLDWNLVTDLPARVEACRYLQSVWQKEFQSIETMLLAAQMSLQTTVKKGTRYNRAPAGGP